LDQAASALGRPPDSFRDTIPPRRLSTLWRLHGRLASARGDQSRAIAMHGRALKQAEAAHDSRSIGLAHYELGQCYRQVGEVALATLGQICVRLGDLTRAEDALVRALDVRSPIQFHETTGAVFDTLAQIHLIRGRYDTASEFLARASEAYGAYGRQTSQWYEWSVRVLGARLALRRGSLDEAVSRVDEILQAGAPPFDALQATLIAAEALTAGNRAAEAEQRLQAAADGLDPQVAPAAWGEYLRLRGMLHARTSKLVDAAALPELLGRETAAALLDATAGDASVVFVHEPGGDVHVIASAGCDDDAARTLARAAANGLVYGRGTLVVESLGRAADGPRLGLIASPRPIGDPVMRRLRMIAAVARQGFALCSARDRQPPVVGSSVVRSVEPLLPGFLSASAAMTRVVEQIQRLSGNDLTVLITGESGTGKELV